jgi:hypothetical protein
MAVTINGTTGIGYADDIKHKLGTGDDLQLHHDGSHSYLNNSTGRLRIQGDDVRIEKEDGSEFLARFTANGAAELYYDDSKKFETESTGVRVHGALRLPDFTGSNEQLQLGDSQDLKIYHDGSHSFIKDDGTGTLRIEASEVGILSADGSETMAQFVPNGAVSLRYDNSTMFETTAQGIKITGTDSGGGRVIPAADNAGYIGENSHRWIAVYAVNGSIQTSDKTEKNTIVESDLGLNFVNKLKPVSYKWNAKQLGNKTHYGLIAQDIEEAVKSEGKTLDDFAAVTKEDGVAMGLGYCELLSPLIKAVQELSAEVTTLKTKVAALEAA